MPEVVTFGEAMLRLSPPDFKRLEQTVSLEMNAGGAELSVAADLARLGVTSSWVSVLPDNPLGAFIRNKAREQGVETSFVSFSKDGRAGIYFVEYGASPRASKVVYDRAYSCISRVTPSDIDWKRVLDGAKWFHTTGITPALSPSAAEVTELAIRTAKEMGLTVSYDLNYRAKLWSPDDAAKTTQRYAHLIDVCIGNEEDAEKVLGIKASGVDANFARIDHSAYTQVAKQMTAKYGFKHVATSLRESTSVLRNSWSGMLYSEGQQCHFSRKYDLEIVDRLGGGDSFSAGIICGLLSGKSRQESLEFAVAFSALKHTIVSDINWVTEEEVSALLKGSGSRIAR